MGFSLIDNGQNSGQLPGMVDWRKKLEDELAKQGRKMKDVSLEAGLGETYIRDALKRGRGGKLDNLERISIALGKPAGWLLSNEPDDAEPAPLNLPLPPTPRPPSNASEPVPTPRGGDDRIPILGVGRGGDDGRFELNGETIGYTMRPKSLIGVKGAYSIYVVGDSMEPRYEAGELVQVNPHKPPQPGRDVVVQLYPTADGEQGEGLIKRLVSITPTFVNLKQFNPPLDIPLERKIVKSIHLIVGRADE